MSVFCRKRLQKYIKFYKYNSFLLLFGVIFLKTLYLSPLYFVNNS